MAGNPAAIICKTSDYIKKNMDAMNERPIFNESYTLRSNELNNEKKTEMIKKLYDGVGYIV
ncbi:hypothetical protein [Clostridium sp. CF012]|uniref:hypothetical protein n=1 Tax=Clostridium sp. CF012 TaxID=2843319 RepID=UPI00209AA8F2|nr:hypothetical protein [Clostridium sp. CF012]